MAIAPRRAYTIFVRVVSLSTAQIPIPGIWGTRPHSAKVISTSRIPIARIAVRSARPAACPTTGRTARCVVAVSAVNQRDNSGEHHGLETRVQEILRRDRQMEEVVVSTCRCAVEEHDDQSGREVTGQESDHVDRDDTDHGSDHPGTREEGDRSDRHRVQRVDFVGDTHGPDLGGETRSDLGGQRDRDDNRGQFTGVGNRGQHAGERGHPDKLEAPVGLDAQHHRRGQRHREDDPDGAAAGQQGVRAEADLADLTEYMLAVLGERKGDRCDSADVESDVLTEGDEAVARGSQGSARLTCSNTEIDERHQNSPTAGTITV